MINQPQIMFQGNLTDNPELRYTASGDGVVSFSVAVNPRIKSGGEWKDGEPIFYRVTAWGFLAENIVESLHRGDPVVIIGRMHRETWQAKEGDQMVSKFADKVTADSVSVPLDRRIVRMTKVTREPRQAADESSGEVAGE